MLYVEDIAIYYVFGFIDLVKVEHVFLLFQSGLLFLGFHSYKSSRIVCEVEFIFNLGLKWIIYFAEWKAYSIVCIRCVCSPRWESTFKSILLLLRYIWIALSLQ